MTALRACRVQLARMQHRGGKIQNYEQNPDKSERSSDRVIFSGFQSFYKFIMLLTSRDEIEDQERSGSGISRTDGDSEDVSRYGQTPLIGVWGWNFSHTSFEERGIAISPS